MAKTETGRPRTHWFRVYTGIMDDAKVMQLSCSHFKTWMLCLCMAKEGAGTLPSIDVIAFKLRLRPDVTQKHIDHLIQVGLIDCKDSTLTPHNWDKYQYASDVSTTRVERYRERQRNAESNDNETFQQRPQRTENREQRTDIPQTPVAALPLSDAVESKSQKAKLLLAKQESWFDQWWAIVWRKHGRADAHSKFLKVVREESVFLEIMTATRLQSDFMLSRDEQYRPMMATWLNKGRWKDDPSAYAASGTAQSYGEPTTLFVPKPRPVEDDGPDDEPWDLDTMFRVGAQQ